MKQICIGLLFLMLGNLAYAQTITFPYSKKVNYEETHWNTTVTDPYHWLENLDDVKVNDWIARQNLATQSHINQAAKGLLLNDNLYRKGYNGRDKSIIKRSKYYFVLSYPNYEDMPVLYYSSKVDGYYEQLINPNKIEGEGVKKIIAYESSKNDKYLFYQYNTNGSDWAKGGVVAVKDRIFMKDKLDGLRFSSVVWDSDEGFYYTRSMVKDDQMGVIDKQAVYYHKVGTKQSEDRLVFKRKEASGLTLDLTATEDGRYMIMTEKHPLKGYSYFYIDLHSDINMLRPLILKTSHEIRFFNTLDDMLLCTVSLSGNNGFIAKIDPAQPKKIIPLSEVYNDAMLMQVIKLKDKLIGVYQSFQSTILMSYSFEGDLQFSLPFGAGYGLKNFIYDDDEDLLYFYMSSYVMPAILYKLNPKTYTFEKIESLNMSYDYRDYVIRSEIFKSKDGTEVPIVIAYKKGTKRDGTNPTLLKAYGGFGVVSTPYFDPGLMYFLDKGGVFAFASIRGGGDNGDQWAANGRRRYKQNCFDDFIGAAEYLIEEKYTKPEKLAITGGSHGGLVVGAAVTQRPELFGLVIPQVGAFDMIRFEQFTVGNVHVNEFGTVEDSLDFLNLLSYSPLHNIDPKVNYPTMLVMTSDNDERVPPFHSYKFVAALQSNPSQTNPIYLRVEKNAGHYGAQNIKAIYKEDKDFYAFLLHHLVKKRK